MKFINIAILTVLAKAITVQGLAIDQIRCPGDLFIEETQGKDLAQGNEEFSLGQKGGARMSPDSDAESRENVNILPQAKNVPEISPETSPETVPEDSPKTSPKTSTETSWKIQDQKNSKTASLLNPNCVEEDAETKYMRAKVANLVANLDVLYTEMEETHSGMDVDIEHYVSLREFFYETIDLIKGTDREGSTRQILRAYSCVPIVLDAVAKDFCKENMNAVGCDSI